MVSPKSDAVMSAHPTRASPPHRDTRDDWRSSLNEPVHLTHSLLAALILEPLLGQLLQRLLELLEGDGPAGLPSVGNRPCKSSGSSPLESIPHAYHPFLHFAVIPTDHSQKSPATANSLERIRKHVL